MVAIIEEVRVGEGTQIGLVFDARVRHPNGDELVRLGEWKRFKQDRVDHAEDGGICPNPERERHDRDDRERGMFEELAKAVADVV